MLTRDYHRYIQSEQWKARCLMYWNLQGRWCRGCLSTKRLVVHHLSYDHFKNEPISDLIGLCHTCHLEVHARHRKTGRRQDIRTVTGLFIREKTLDRLRRKNT